MSLNGSITGRIVAELEDRKVSDKLSILEFPLYSDRRVKNRETGEYESDPNGTTKVRVGLKFDERDKALGVLKKGDVVKITGSFYERSYTNKDGVAGRSLETDYIESVEVVFSKDTAAAGDGFVPSDANAGGFV